MAGLRVPEGLYTETIYGMVREIFTEGVAKSSLSLSLD